MYLFLDTETSDLPRHWNAPVSQVENWPRIVQVAWISCDEQCSVIDSQTRLIKPVDFSIAPGAFAVHGISTDFAMQHGEEIGGVLDDLASVFVNASELIAHNMDFDATIVTAEFLRSQRADPLQGKNCHCTMKESTDYCQLPGNYGHKWPKLSELYSLLFHEQFQGAHDAGADCLACMNCYFRLKELGVMQ